MKLFFAAIILFFNPIFSFSQEATTLIAEGQKLELKLKEDEAFAKYKQALATQPSNVTAAVKCAEMAANIGSRENDKDKKTKLFTEAKDYAATAVLYGAKSADANYAMAMAFGKMTEVESSNSKIVEYVKSIKTFVDKALVLDSNHGKALYSLGKWHYEILNLNILKKAAVKVIYGGLATADIDTCIAAFEKCKKVQPYFALNYMALANAYYYKKQYEKALVALQECIKCPTLHQDDPTIKEQAKKLLKDWQ